MYCFSFNFVATSVTWLLMQVEFLALALIVVYVGAVLVLFLFVVMMIDVDETVEQNQVTNVAYCCFIWSSDDCHASMALWQNISACRGSSAGPLPVSYSSVQVLGDAL